MRWAPAGDARGIFRLMIFQIRIRFRRPNQIRSGMAPRRQNDEISIEQCADYRELQADLKGTQRRRLTVYPELSTALILVYLYVPKDFPRGKAAGWLRRLW
jgi:hypothetical protein